MFFEISGLLKHEKSEEITIHETSANTMKKILFFMYHESMDESKIDSELLQAADKYLMTGLVTICVKYLKSNLTLENALDVMIIAYQINQNSLLEAAFEYAQKNKGKMKNDKWKEMSRNHPDLMTKCFNQVLGIS